MHTQTQQREPTYLSAALTEGWHLVCTDSETICFENNCCKLKKRLGYHKQRLSAGYVSATWCMMQHVYWLKISAVVAKGFTPTCPRYTRRVLIVPITVHTLMHITSHTTQAPKVQPVNRMRKSRWLPSSVTYMSCELPWAEKFRSRDGEISVKALDLVSLPMYWPVYFKLGFQTLYS